MRSSYQRIWQDRVGSWNTSQKYLCHETYSATTLWSRCPTTDPIIQKVNIGPWSQVLSDKSGAFNDQTLETPCRSRRVRAQYIGLMTSSCFCARIMNKTSHLKRSTTSNVENLTPRTRTPSEGWKNVKVAINLAQLVSNEDTILIPVEVDVQNISDAHVILLRFEFQLHTAVVWELQWVSCMPSCWR